MSDDRVQLSDLHNAVNDVRDRLNRLESLIDELPKNGGKMREGDDMPLNIGQSYSGIVSDDGSGTKHGDPLTHANGVVTFLKTDEKVTVGDNVEFVISATDQNHAKGVVTEVNPDE